MQKSIYLPCVDTALFKQRMNLYSYIYHSFFNRKNLLHKNSNSHQILYLKLCMSNLFNRLIDFNMYFLFFYVELYGIQ